MAATLMACPLRHLPGTVDAGGGVALERYGVLGLAPFHGLARRPKLGGDTALLIRIPAPGKQQAGACGEEEKDLRHG
jgi:hypothetical protein